MFYLNMHLPASRILQATSLTFNPYKARVACFYKCRPTSQEQAKGALRSNTTEMSGTTSTTYR